MWNNIRSQRKNRVSLLDKLCYVIPGRELFHRSIILRCVLCHAITRIAGDSPPTIVNFLIVYFFTKEWSINSRNQDFKKKNPSIGHRDEFKVLLSLNPRISSHWAAMQDNEDVDGPLDEETMVGTKDGRRRGKKRTATRNAANECEKKSGLVSDVADATVRYGILLFFFLYFFELH